MVSLTIDGKRVSVAEGSTILDAAKAVGAQVPTMCHLEGHDAGTSCMVCVVRVNGSARLVPSCATRAAEGMDVDCSGPEVVTARRTALELLLSDHVGDCVGPCATACPAHMDIPAMIGAIADGRYDDAIAIVKERIPIPAILGRICPEICERGCRRAAYDAAVSICLLKRHVADLDLASPKPYTAPVAPPSGRRIAVVGAGPAGLSAAYFLRVAGHECALMDRRGLPGGALRDSIADDRLPSAVIDAEVAGILRLGVEFAPGKGVDDADALDALRRRFDAVVLAVGPLDEESVARLGLKWGGHGIHVDHATHMTSLDGVFAAGSCAHPSHASVRAVAEGRAVAEAVTGGVVHPKPFSVHIGRVHEGELDALMGGASRMARASSDGLSAAEAVGEARRCMRCDCAKATECRLREYSAMYGANAARYKGDRRPVTVNSEHPEVVCEAGKCIACGVCVRIAEDAGEPLGLTFLGRGFDVRPGTPFGESLADALGGCAARCAEACPTGALSLRRGRVKA